MPHHWDIIINEFHFLLQRCVQFAGMSALMHVCTLHTFFAIGKKIKSASDLSLFFLIHLYFPLSVLYNSTCALSEWRSIPFHFLLSALLSFFNFMSVSASELWGIEMGLTLLLPQKTSRGCVHVAQQKILLCLTSLKYFRSTLQGIALKEKLWMLQCVFAFIQGLCNCESGLVGRQGNCK